MLLEINKKNIFYLVFTEFVYLRNIQESAGIINKNRWNILGFCLMRSIHRRDKVPPQSTQLSQQCPSRVSSPFTILKVHLRSVHGRFSCRGDLRISDMFFLTQCFIFPFPTLLKSPEIQRASINVIEWTSKNFPNS